MAPKRLSRNTFSLRIDHLLPQVRACAEAKGQTMNDFMEEAIRKHIQACAAELTETSLAPVIEQIIEGQLRTRIQSLRNYVGRLHAEIHRTQYLLIYLMKNAGMPQQHEEVLMEKAWDYAVERMNDRPKMIGGVVDDDPGTRRR